MSATVLLAATSLLAIGQAGPVQAEPDCVNGGVYMLGVRGSGARIGSTEVKKFRDSVRSQLGGIPDAWAELGNLGGTQRDGEDAAPGGYPATGGPNFVQALWAWMVDPGYGNSVRIGTDELVRHLNDRATRCPYETVVLGGYSQGADVIGWALERTGGGDAWSLNTNARNHIGAVALYGDPKYLGNFGSRLGNCVQPPWAIISETCPDLPTFGILGARTPYVPSDIWSRVSSYCADQDGVCRGNWYSAAFGSHTTAYQNWLIAASAGRIAAIALSKWNQLNPALPPAPGAQQPASGSPPQAPSPSLAASRQMFLRGDSAVFAKDSLENGGWIQESEPGSIRQIAAGGRYQMVLNACNAVYARDTLGMEGWIQQTPCGGASKIAISNAGLQMVIDACSAVWAKVGISAGTPFTQEVGCGNATAIAVGGNTQMFIRGDAAIFAKNWVGNGGWVQEVGPGNATAIAVDATGLQAFIRGDAAVFAKRGIGDGGWQMQVGPGNAGAIAAGSGVLMFLRGDGAVFAKTDISRDGGWLQQADPHTVTAIAMGNSNRMMVRSNTNAIYAKDNLVNGDWRLQVGDGNAAAIAVG